MSCTVMLYLYDFALRTFSAICSIADSGLVSMSPQIKRNPNKAATPTPPNAVNPLFHGKFFRKMCDSIPMSCRLRPLACRRQNRQKPLAGLFVSSDRTWRGYRSVDARATASRPSSSDMRRTRSSAKSVSASSVSPRASRASCSSDKQVICPSSLFRNQRGQSGHGTLQ